VTENFASLLEGAARRWPGKPALAWDAGSLTWTELDRRAGGVARALARQGVGVGHTIALALPNGWPFVAALLGGLKLGATVAPLNPRLTPDERARIVGHLRPKIVVDEVSPEEAAGFAAAKATSPALILYTSGSTGQPKGVVLSHAAVRVANESWAGPVMRLTPADSVLAALPLAHSFGLNGALLAPLLAGATVVVLDRFAPEKVLPAMGRHRVTVLPGVPTMFRRLLDSPALATAGFASLRLAVAGAAPCPWELAQEWRRRTGVRIVRGYGMTELFRPVSYLADDPADLEDAVGRPVPGVEVRLVDEAGRPVGNGEVGELWICTPAAMDGYLDAPEETRAVLGDGWFKTGDLATISPDGFIQIVGRKREVILRAGYSVVPAEIEAVLLTHPAVAEAAVTGLPHAELGEEVAAFVALRPAAQVRPDELVAYCKERLAPFKYPRQVVMLDRLPKSATGKILKASLRAQALTG
jgi:long-chain acyl-CoA synthetase